MSACRKPSPSPPSSTVFDNVYKTILQKLTVLVIPFINEVFGKNYAMDTAVEQLASEHAELFSKIITDSLLRIGGMLYHLECQSNPDGTMVIRMFEYDFAIALNEARREGTPHRVRFPFSAVIYLRHTSATPDRLALEVEFPDGQAVTYSVPVIKVQDYSLDEILNKKLWILIPYYIMRYESQFTAMEEDASKRKPMLADLREMSERLEEQLDREDLESIYPDLMDLAEKVAGYMLKEKKRTRKGVSSIMGGKVLELHSERVARLSKAKGRKEGMKEGRKEGMKEGRKEGRKEGLLEGIRAMIATMKDLSIDRSQAVEQLMKHFSLSEKDALAAVDANW